MAHFRRIRPSSVDAVMEADFMAGNRPGFEPGISLVTEDDDGSEEFNGRWSNIRDAKVLIER